jgi:hypothetical protein
MLIAKDGCRGQTWLWLREGNRCKVLLFSSDDGNLDFKYAQRANKIKI